MSFQKYPKYKDSGIEWLGEIPEHWEALPLKHIVAIPVTDGPHETPKILDEGIPFISAEAIRSNKVDFSKKRGFISESEHRRFCLKYHPKRDDIYMVKSGATTGNLAIVETDEEFSIWSPLAVIRCQREKAVARFVLSAMNSKEFQNSIHLSWSFGTQQNIGMNVIENLPIPLPPLPEQQAIASFLDRETAKIDDLVKEAEHTIELLKEKRQAVISHAVTKGLDPNAPMKDSGSEWLGEIPEHWGETHFKYVCELNPSVDFSKLSDDDEVTFLPMDRVKNGYFIPNSECLSKLNSSYNAFSDGDILIAKVTPCFENGNIALARDLIHGVGFGSSELFVIRPLTAHTLFIFYYLQTDYFKQQGESTMTGAGGLKRISSDMVENHILWSPPLPEQQTIASFLDRETAKIDDLVKEAEHTIDLLKERRTALISAAVTGKIDVRTCNTEPTEKVVA